MSRHKNLTGADLHIPGYYQDADPGAIGAGRLWIDTTGIYQVPKYRNDADNGWNVLHPVILERQTPSAAAQADFVLPTGFTSYRVMGWLAPATDSVAVWARLSNDGGSTFRSGATDYDYYENWTRMSAAAAGTNRSSAGQAQFLVVGFQGNAAGESSQFDLAILGARTATARTSIVGRSVFIEPTPQQVGAEFAGVLRAGAEVNDAIRFLFSTGNIASGELTLIGIP